MPRHGASTRPFYPSASSVQRQTSILFNPSAGIFYIDAHIDVLQLYWFSLAFLCRSAETFIRDKYDKKKYMDKCIDIQTFRVSLDS